MDRQSFSLPTRTVIYIIMMIFAVLAIYPIFWVIINSFKSTQEYLTTSKLALPVNWQFTNYPFAWRVGRFTTLFSNSIVYTGITVVSVVALSIMAGFGFAKLKFKITPLLHGLFIIGILLTIQSILVPLFLMVNTVGLFNTRLGIIIPYVGLGLPMGVYLCTEYIKGISSDILESARIDGAGYFMILTRIIFPMCYPVAVTLAIITFTATWNEFILVNILTSSDTIRTLPVGISRFASPLQIDYGRQFTGLTIALIPILIFYMIFRKQITKGVAAGAVKG